MRAWCTVVTLAIVALFTSGLRVPAVPLHAAGQERDERIAAARAAAPFALCPLRPGRALEAARKAVPLAVLPGRLALTPALGFTCVTASVAVPVFHPRACPRTARGPPSRA